MALKGLKKLSGFELSKRKALRKMGIGKPLFRGELNKAIREKNLAREAIEGEKKRHTANVKYLNRVLPENVMNHGVDHARGEEIKKSQAKLDMSIKIWQPKETSALVNEIGAALKRKSDFKRDVRLNLAGSKARKR